MQAKSAMTATTDLVNFLIDLTAEVMENLQDDGKVTPSEYFGLGAYLFKVPGVVSSFKLIPAEILQGNSEDRDLFRKQVISTIESHKNISGNFVKLADAIIDFILSGARMGIVIAESRKPQTV